MPAERAWRPSRAVLVSRGRIRTSRVSMAKALDALEERVDRVLDEHMRSEVSFGLFLFGGVDSGALPARLSVRVQEPIRAY